MNKLFDLESPIFKLLAKAVDIMIINVLFILGCIPIFTIGASLTALYKVTLKMVSKEDMYIVREFMLAFKKNFKVTTAVWGIMVFIGFLFAVNYQLLQNFSGVLYIFSSVVLAVFTFIYLCVFTFIFPYIALYENSTEKFLINSLIISLSNISYMLFLIPLTVILSIFFFSSEIGLITGIYLGTFGGFALLALYNSFFINKIFKKYNNTNLQ